MLAVVKAAVSDGDYGSTGEVILGALRDSKMKRNVQQQEFVALNEVIQQGLADAASGQIAEFNADHII